jgi:hypothetical protein
VLRYIPIILSVGCSSSSSPSPIPRTHLVVGARIGPLGRAWKIFGDRRAGDRQRAARGRRRLGSAGWPPPRRPPVSSSSRLFMIPPGKNHTLYGSPGFRCYAARSVVSSGRVNSMGDRGPMVRRVVSRRHPDRRGIRATGRRAAHAAAVDRRHPRPPSHRHRTRQLDVRRVSRCHDDAGGCRRRRLGAPSRGSPARRLALARCVDCRLRAAVPSDAGPATSRLRRRHALSR